MRRISGSLVFVLVALSLSAVTITPASAGSTAVDSFCSESGDYCTFVIEKDDGTILFKIRGFADYFGRAKACVSKDTRVCHKRLPHRDGIIFEWSILWQGNYPDEGPGRYSVRWFSKDGYSIGPRLHFERD